MDAPLFPPAPDAALVLADGKVFWGFSIGAHSDTYGEICFNTAMTGYQEVLTDPSYAGQIITFTFPHIGNVGANAEDVESFGSPYPNPLPKGEGISFLLLPGEGGAERRRRAGACGLVIREPLTNPSNFRSASHLDAWLKAQGIAGISGIDTRALTRHIRLNGAQNAAIVRVKSRESRVELEKAYKKLQTLPNMEGMELAQQVTTQKSYDWTEDVWQLTPTPSTHHSPLATRHHVVAIDYGEKLNILRLLTHYGCKVTVVSAPTSAEDILKLKPDGIFLSNGPGDPAATGKYAVPIIQELIESGTPIFGICLGHQLLGLALGAKTEKMKQGHRGANHPIKNLETGKVEITAQNHGFVVSRENLPADVIPTHVSLFDGTIAGLRVEGKPIFCVQYHPESSPGPHDSRYLFAQFVKMMEKKHG